MGLQATGLSRARENVEVRQSIRHKMGWQDWVVEIIKYILLISLSLTFLLPLFWMATSGLKNDSQVYSVPPVWIPMPARWLNYWEAWNIDHFNLFAFNTIFRYAFPVTFGTVLSSTIVAYGFSRVRWPLRNVFFAVCMATMMIPGQVTMVPLFVLFRKFGWVNTYWPMVVPSFFGSPYYIFMLRQFFRTIPADLTDAARIDGATELQVLWHILLPLVRPALAVIGLFTFMGAWNDYMGPLIYINRSSMYPLSVGLASLSINLSQRGISKLAYPYLMAVSTIVTLPIVFIFFYAQRTFVEGISLTGLKG
jgi:ABC-type glycerol-3-phosphate transport system permease component